MSRLCKSTYSTNMSRMIPDLVSSRGSTSLLIQIAVNNQAAFALMLNAGFRQNYVTSLSRPLSISSVMTNSPLCSVVLVVCSRKLARTVVRYCHRRLDSARALFSMNV